MYRVVSFHMPDNQGGDNPFHIEAVYNTHSKELLLWELLDSNEENKSYLLSFEDVNSIEDFIEQAIMREDV